VKLDCATSVENFELQLHFRSPWSASDAAFLTMDLASLIILILACCLVVGSAGAPRLSSGPTYQVSPHLGPPMSLIRLRPNTRLACGDGTCSSFNVFKKIQKDRILIALLTFHPLASASIQNTYRRRVRGSWMLVGVETGALERSQAERTGVGMLWRISGRIDWVGNG